MLSTQLQNAAGAKDGEPARPRRRRARAEPHAHRRPRSEAVFLLRGVRPGAENGAPQLRTSLAFYRGKVKVFETPVVERRAARRDRSPRGGLPVRGAGRQPQARALHLPGEHHRRGGRQVRVSAARAVRAVNHTGDHIRRVSGTTKDTKNTKSTKHGGIVTGVGEPRGPCSVTSGAEWLVRFARLRLGSETETGSICQTQRVAARSYLPLRNVAARFQRQRAIPSDTHPVEATRWPLGREPGRR